MQAGNLCVREVVTVDPGETLTQAAHLMRQHHIGLLVVVEADGAGPDLQVIGVLTDRDIVTAVIARKVDLDAVFVADVMTRCPLLVSEASSLDSVLYQMREAGVRRVPVVGFRNELVGVLSLDDVLDEMARMLADVAGAIRRGRRVERTVRPERP
ncbi:MAG TPA: CBS domain-containing protein [Steroidobacteraceae bacterium]|nr:CBS domain-containing protein [Steroidobacteraceae bacterium]